MGSSVFNMNRLTASTKVNGLTWQAWWQRFVTIADHNKIPVGRKQEYFEYWEDGDSPEDALAMEAS